MLIVISPAKKLDFDTVPITDEFTTCDYLEQSEKLIDVLRNFSALDIAELMKLSTKLSELNFARYENWQPNITPQNGKQALLAFKGDVYAGMSAETFTLDDLEFAQQHLRMLSGLYGLLRPLDLMMPYRLEMGTRLTTERGKNLYDFWGTRITDGLNKQLVSQGDDKLVNLASNEYFKSVKPKEVNGEIITPQFKEWKNGDYKMIGIYAKRARGLMSRYIIENRLSSAEDIKSFDYEGYAYNDVLSSESNWVFTRNLMAFYSGKANKINRN